MSALVERLTAAQALQNPRRGGTKMSTRSGSSRGKASRRAPLARIGRVLARLTGGTRGQGESVQSLQRGEDDRATGT